MGIGNMVSGGLAYKGTQKALEAQKDAAKDLTSRMATARQDVIARRPQIQQDRQVALQRQLALLGPMNGLVNEMGGGRYGLNLGPELSKSPVSMQASPSQLGVPTRGEYGGAYEPGAIERARRQGYDTSKYTAAPKKGAK